MAKEIDRVAERQVDDSWTATRLIALGAGTLILALSVIWYLGATFAPPGY